MSKRIEKLQPLALMLQAAPDGRSPASILVELEKDAPRPLTQKGGVIGVGPLRGHLKFLCDLNLVNEASADVFVWNGNGQIDTLEKFKITLFEACKEVIASNGRTYTDLLKDCDVKRDPSSRSRATLANSLGLNLSVKVVTAILDLLVELGHLEQKSINYYEAPGNRE